RWKYEFAPRSPEDEPNERYVEACKKLDYVEYLMREARWNGKEQKVD
ncbi:MAG TPA: DNA primase, partial [Candidatus Scatomorpha pullicola]|nr:DNA primase [Candidatus Scatomorpha pullicola]